MRRKRAYEGKLAGDLFERTAAVFPRFIVLYKSTRGNRVILENTKDYYSHTDRWPSKTSFLLGGDGKKSVFSMLDEAYRFEYPSYLYKALKKDGRLAGLAGLAGCKTLEELAMKMDLTGI